jgi:hypothetical protein
MGKERHDFKVHTVFGVEKSMCTVVKLREGVELIIVDIANSAFSSRASSKDQLRSKK